MFIEVWHDLLEECIVYAEESIRTAALDALGPFWTTYHQPTTEDKVQWRDSLVARYTNVLDTTDKELHCSGYAAALGESNFYSR